MKNFAIYGAIVDADDQRTTIEDLTPGQFRAFINKLEPNEELEIAINSPGGSCFGGIAIANMIRKLSQEGHTVTAFVEGVAASIASVIMCACDKVVMGESSLIMIHNCWSVVQGDSNTLRKEADTMDTINEAILSFYRSKFDLTDEQLKAYMDAETWFSGREVADFNFKCEVIPDADGFSIAAKLKDIDLTKFKHLPKALNMEKEDTKQVGEIKDEVVEVKAEQTVEQPEEVKDEVIEDMIPKAECDKRVSGMQSTMAKQLDSMKKEYEAKIQDFEVQMKVKDEELAKFKAEATSLNERLDKTAKELSEVTSALAEKTTALDALNAGVNTPNETETKPWKKLSGEALLKWCREHQAR